MIAGTVVTGDVTFNQAWRHDDPLVNPIYEFKRLTRLPVSFLAAETYSETSDDRWRWRSLPGTPASSRLARHKTTGSFALICIVYLRMLENSLSLYCWNVVIVIDQLVKVVAISIISDIDVLCSNLRAGKLLGFLSPAAVFYRAWFSSHRILQIK